MKYISSYDVWDWPEFQALIKRLGLARTDDPPNCFVLTLDMEEPARMETYYTKLAQDLQEYDE